MEKVDSKKQDFKFSTDALFKETDKRISEIELEKYKLKEEEARIERIKMKEQKLLAKKNTEEYAESILSLVSDTLSTANSKVGDIDVHKYHMGNPIPNGELNSLAFSVFSDLAKITNTGYKIDDEGLHIILNYSSYAYGFDDIHGGSFDDQNIDYTYLRKLLKPYSIYVQKVERTFASCGDGEREDIKFIEITLLREKKLETGYVRKLAAKYNRYKSDYIL